MATAASFSPMYSSIMALAMIARLLGDEIAVRVAEGTEYDVMQVDGATAWSSPIFVKR